MLAFAAFATFAAIFTSYYANDKKTVEVGSVSQKG